MTPDSAGNFKGIVVPRLPASMETVDVVVPQQETPIKRYTIPPATEGDWVEQYHLWRERRGYVASETG